MVSKKITNILLWFSFVCWIVIIPVLIYCDSDPNLNINVGFGHLFGVFLQLISALTGKAFDKALVEGPYIVAIFSAVILFLVSLLWLIPCLKAKKKKTMIISIVNLAIINVFFIIMFIVMYSIKIKIGNYVFALYTVVTDDGYSVYHTVFLLMLPFLLTISVLIPYIISMVNEGKDLSDNKQAKRFNTERKAAINLNKGQIGASGRQAVKSMVSNQELKSEPSSVSDLKSKVNRLKSQLENQDYTSSFKANNNLAPENEYDTDFKENDQTTGYIPTSELFIKPPRVGHDESDGQINPNLRRNNQLNDNAYDEEDFYDNNDFSINQSKVISNLIYPSSSKNRFDQQQDKPFSQLTANQYPFDIDTKKAPRVNRAIVDSKYNNKIVIGDTDKIWDATKKAREQYSKSSDNEE